MENRLKRILQVASVYIGTVIGAGFASGQEMLSFFTVYGIKGMIGLVLAGVAYALIGMVLLEVIYEKKFDHYKELLKDVMGPKLSVMIEWTVNIFLFICLSTMIAGAGAIFKQAFNLPTWVGVVGMALAALFTFFSGAQGLVKMNALLVPIMCIGGILLGSIIMIFRDLPVFAVVGGDTPARHWLLSAVLYVAYNMITVIVVLCSLYDHLDDIKVARWGGILGGLGLGVLGLSIGGATFFYYAQINQLEIPMLGILVNYPKYIQSLYMVVLVLAMYTTAIANGHGVIENLKVRLTCNEKLLMVAIVGLAMLSAKIGFSNLVSRIFPMFGYIGLFEIIMIMVYYSCMKWEHRRK
ncbi:MAG: YkvI family membrane protein [Cellulosilyticaceae bacterium]